MDYSMQNKIRTHESLIINRSINKKKVFSYSSTTTNKYGKNDEIFKNAILQSSQKNESGKNHQWMINLVKES